MTAAAHLVLSAIVLPDLHPPRRFLADVVAAEAAGVRTVWTYDHLRWPTLGDGPWYGSIPLLAAAAALTSTARLGLQVATPNFRHPVPFAKELMTLDQLTEGRLEVGVGAGTEGPDAAVMGNAPRSRGDRSERFAEWIALLDVLLREPVTTVEGARFSAVEAHQLPGCAQQPRVPFTVAATARKGLDVVARHGQAWVTNGPHGPQVDPETWLAALEGQSAHLSERLAAAGRSSEDVRRIAQFAFQIQWPFSSSERYADTVGRLAAAGFSEIAVHWSRLDGNGVPEAALPMVLAAHGH